MRVVASSHRMSSWIVVAGLIAAACGGTAAEHAASAAAIAALVPVDTVVYARLASIDALSAAATPVATAFGGDASAVGRDALLANLRGIGGDTSQVDAARAVGFAVVAPKATRPTLVFFVPVVDGAKYAASLRASGLQAAVHGDYACVPLGGEYQKPAAPSALADGMPAGVVAVRIDVAKAAANLGVMIQSGLDVFERQMAKQFAAHEAGLDGEAMAELYSGLAKALLASGTTLDVALDATGGRLDVHATYTAKPGSALDGWSAPPVDVSSFAGKLTGRAAVELLGVADWAALWPKIEPMMTTLLDVYPPAMRSTMERLMAAYPAVYSHIGPVMVGGIDLADGIAFDLHIAPRDAQALLRELDALVARPELAELGMSFTRGPANDEPGGTTREYVAKFDLSRLPMAPTDAAKSQAMAKEMQAALQAMFASDGVPVRVAAVDGRGAILVGKRRGDPAAALAPAPGSWPTALQPAMAAVAGCNPLLVERIDFASMMRAAAAFEPATATRALPTPPADARCDMVIGAGVRGAEWRALMSIDLAGFGGLMRASQRR